MRLTKAFGRQPRGWIFAEMIAVLLVIGVLDYTAGYEVRLLPFYAVPIFAVSWFCGRRLGLIAAVVAGIVSLTADWLTRDPDLVQGIWAWEVARHLGTCLAVAIVGLALRAKSDIVSARIALLEHTQKLERRIVGITDAEQTRIGQELHDGICQYLAALSFSARSLQDDLERLHLNGEASAASDLADRLQEAVAQTRDLAHGLVPAHVTRVGLVLALESLAHSVSHLQGINCQFEFHGVAQAYEESTAKHLYRIAQEAINNATRHGNARNIAISLEATELETILRILDDGTGISEQTPNGSGLGLDIMRYRAHATGGELHIEQPASGGTLIWCTAATKPNEFEIATVS